MLRLVPFFDTIRSVYMKRKERILRIVACLNPSAASQKRLSGIYRYAGHIGDWVVVAAPQPNSEEDFRQMLRRYNPDGIISSHLCYKVTKKARAKIPAVVMDGEMASGPGFNAVLQCDNRMVGSVAAETLYAKGFRHFAFIGVAEDDVRDHITDVAYAKTRMNGFAAFLARHGIRHLDLFQPGCRMEDPFDNFSDMVRWIKSLELPCGLFVYNDALAAVSIAACRHLKIAVPEQVAVIGVDNNASICENTQPPLTSIDLDFEDSGYRAAELLDGFMRKKRNCIVQERYDVKRVVERASTMNIGGIHQRIIAAQRIIINRTFDGLTVMEMAKTLGLSKRTLEISFRKVMGRSVRRTITTMRLDEAKHHLLTTRKTFGEIAETCGFRSQAALAALFKRHEGISMQAFRRQNSATISASDVRTGS